MRYEQETLLQIQCKTMFFIVFSK